jgi:phage gp29-like protein
MSIVTVNPHSLAAQGAALPPVRTASAGLSADPKPAAAKLDPIFGNVSPNWENYLRPQAAFQWWTLPYLSSITPQYVQQILIGGLAGNHVACWQMFNLMPDTNPEIVACIGEWIDGILAKKLVIEPYHEEDTPPTANAIRNQRIVAAAFRNMLPEIDADENALKETMRDIAFDRFHGQSVLGVNYYQAEDSQDLYTLDIPNIGTILAPRCTYWVHPVCYAWDISGRMGLRIPLEDLRDVTKSARANRAGTLPTDFGLANGLSFTGYSGSPRPASLQRFPANQFLLGVTKMQTGSALGASCLRPLAGFWVYENFAADFAMDYAQIFGIPFRTATFSANTSEEDKAFVREMLQNMGSRGWALLPDGVKLEFEKSMSNGAETPQGFLIKLCHEQYRKVILRQTMTGSGHGGAAQGSKGGMSTEQDVKAICIQAGADHVADVLREQFARQIIFLNTGRATELPFIRLADEEEGSLEEMQRDQIGAQLVPIGENYFRRKYNYPKPAPGETVAKMPTPPPSATGGDTKPTTNPDPDAPKNPDQEMNAAKPALEAAALAGANWREDLKKQVRVAITTAFIKGIKGDQAAIGTNKKTTPLEAGEFHGNQYVTIADEKWSGSPKEMHERADKIMRGFTSANHPKLGEVKFTRLGRSKTLYDKRTPHEFQSVQAIPQLVEKGTLVSSLPDRKGRPDIIAVHKIEHGLKIGEAKYHAEVTVRESWDGKKTANKFYLHRIHEK